MTKDRSFFSVNCQKVIRRVIRFLKKKSSKWSFGQVEGCFDTTVGEKKRQEANTFCPMPKLIWKQIFPNVFFSQKNKPLDTNNAVLTARPTFLRKRLKGFVQTLTLTKNRMKQKWSSSKKGSFQQKVLGHEDCSFDKSNEKFPTKRAVVFAQCPKMQVVKKKEKKFFQNLFSSKSSDGQVRNRYWLPIRKNFVKRVKTCGSIFDTDKKAQKFLFFIHQIIQWTREIEVLKTSPNFSWRKAAIFLVASQSHQKCCELIKKIMKMVVWTSRKKFCTTAGKKLSKGHIFSVPCPKLIWKQIVPKMFFLKKTILWVLRMQFWQPGRLFWGNANRYCSISDADKTKRNREESFREKVVFNDMF